MIGDQYTTMNRWWPSPYVDANSTLKEGIKTTGVTTKVRWWGKGGNNTSFSGHLSR